MKNVIAFVLCLALIMVFIPTAPVYGGEDPSYDVVVVVSGEGSVSFAGITVTSASAQGTTISATQNSQITITPAKGYYVSSAGVKEGSFDFLMDVMRNISKEEGKTNLILTLDEYVKNKATIYIDFAQENLDSLVTSKTYAVVSGTAADMQNSLAGEFGYAGYNVDPDNISITAIRTSSITSMGYGTFDFHLSGGATQVGYILENPKNALFEYVGSKGSFSVNEIRLAKNDDYHHESDLENGMEFGSPAMDTGTIKLIGVGDFGLEGIHSQDLGDSFDAYSRSTISIKEPFYMAHLHLTSKYKSVEDSDTLNWYKFYLIQDDGLCVKVSASNKNGDKEQATCAWDLNRYTTLNNGNSLSEVYFANDVIKLEIPSKAAIGGITTLSAVTGDFPGYSITTSAVDKNTVSIIFHSNFYDKVTVPLIINSTINKDLVIHRVGVDIEAYQDHNEGDGQVFHGTQYGSRIDFTSDGAYQVYATYYIPSGGAIPGALIVNSVFKDGSTVCKEIRKPKDDPYNRGVNYSNGVYSYEGKVSACDYLLYGGSEEDAPVSINVTVLKSSGEEDKSFWGVNFGSGLGVTWNKK